MGRSDMEPAVKEQQASMFDSIRPSRIPAGTSYIAAYFNGNWPANFTQLERQFPGARIFAIDVLGNGYQHCGIADVENGDMTPSMIDDWVRRRLLIYPDVLCRIYCNQSTWPAAKSAVYQLSPAEQQHIRWWIADPTGTEHMVDGADATQWEWETLWDRSVISPLFISD